MVIKTQKTNIVGALSIFMILLLATCFIGVNSSSAEKVKFEVDVTEVLSVSLTIPDTWASGDVSLTNGSGLLRNKVSLSVTTNNPTGFAAFMASKTTTNLVNTSKSSSYIETLASSSTVSSFPTNRWGYSLDDEDTLKQDANYSALQTSQIAILDSNSPDTASQNIFFGAKADATKDSGTYANTVVFSVISGYVPNDPTPVDPVNPTDDTTPNDGIATHDGDVMVTTTTSSGTQTQPVATSTTTTTTEITPYVAPQGVNVNSDNNLATGLAVAAAVAATSGAAFFVLAKRKKDDDEDEEEI